MNEILVLLAVLAALALLGGAAALIFKSAARRRGLSAARESAASIRAQAEKDAGARLEAAALEAKERLQAAEARLDEEAQQRAREHEEKNAEIERRDKDLKRRVAYADERMAVVMKREAAVAEAEKEAARLREEAERAASLQLARLERIAGLTARQAREELRREMELDARRDAAAAILRAQEEARERCAEDARWIVAQAMQRLPTSQYAETTVTLVALPNDEMKGRIIGREGRNIRSIEMSTGIDLIIDDTPGAILLSSFDPTRRIVAKLAIEKLIEDGRIHPARIEEVVSKVREELERTTVEQGEAAAFELGLHDLSPRLLKMTGRLAHLTFHGQNLLDHCRETAMMASHMAALLGARGEIVRRAGLLHKIGFADESNRDRSPLLQSADLVQRLGEAEPIVHCIQALYGVVAPRSIEAVLLQTAESATVARPGAQKEMLEDYLQRLRQLEEIARSFKGVREAYAVRAGKEVRVIVEAEQVADKEVVWLSKDIAARIEKESSYPGQIKVSVIRETRSVGFAM